MKNIQLLVASTILALGGLLEQANSEVVVSSITPDQFGLLTATSVYHYTAQAGGSSGPNTQECLLRNANTTVAADLLHVFPEALSVRHNTEFDQVMATLGPQTTLSLPTLDHNAIIIQVYNYDTYFAGASFSGITFNGMPVRNMFADLGTLRNTDRLLIQFDTDEGYELSGNIEFDPYLMTGSNNRVEVWGVNAPIIPEPSASFLFGIFVAILLFLRTRKI
jgi:hypothetical protein